MTNKYYQKHKDRFLKVVIKSFLKKKKKKGEKRSEKNIKIILRSKSRIYLSI